MTELSLVEHPRKNEIEFRYEKNSVNLTRINLRTMKSKTNRPLSK